MFESVVHYARMIVSCGPCASIPYASIACSLFALPILVFIQMLYWFFPSVCVFFLAASGFVVLASFIVIAMTPTITTVFIVDKIVGVTFAFMAIPFTAKFMIVGLVAFHCIRLLAPMMFKSFVLFVRMGVWYSVAASLGAGLLTNAFLRLIMWAGS